MSKSSIEDFLATAARSYDQEITDELVYEELKRKFDDILELHDIQTAFRFDDEKCHERCLTVDSDTRARIYEDRAQFSRMLLVLLDQHKNPGTRDIVTDKKAMMAELYVHSGFDDDTTAWMDAADDLMPGVEGLDTSSVDDFVYIQQAQADLATRQHRKEVFRGVVIECVGRLREADDRNAETTHYAEAFKRCVGLYAMNKYQRSAAIDETLRVTGLSRASICMIKDAYRDYYQSTGGYFPVDLL